MQLTEAQRAAIRADAIASGEVPEHLRAEAIRLLSAPASSSSAGASAVHPAGGGLGSAGSTAAARGRAPRRTSDGTTAAPVPNRSTRRLAAAGTKNSGPTEVETLHEPAAPDFAAS